MSDIFHDAVPLEFIDEVFVTMARTPWHTYQILTKRTDRLMKLAPLITWSSNIWVGVSVESAAQKFRIDHLRTVPAAIRFLSLEPLLDSLGVLDLTGIHWVIAGGESGPRCRPMSVEWVQAIRDQCITAHVPFFFKQWGHVRNNPDPMDSTIQKNGGTANGDRLLDGRVWDEMPSGGEVLLPRE